jgi:hypothetical protein
VAGIDTKTCSKCKVNKPLKEFSPRAASRDGRQPACKICCRLSAAPFDAEYAKTYHSAHPGARREATKRFKQRNQDKVNKIKLSRGCVDCGYKKHSEALQFDHVRGEKVDNVSRLVLSARSWSTIEEEISKCEVVCANCHAIRTAERRSASSSEEVDVLMFGGDAQ